LLELLVLEVELLLGELVIPAALPATSDDTLCVSWLKRSEAVEELLLEDAPLCNALTRSPAFDSNCCKLIEPLPLDSCENRALEAVVSLLPEVPVAWL